MNAQGQHAAAATTVGQTYLQLYSDGQNYIIPMPISNSHQQLYSVSAPNINIVPNPDGSYKIVTDNSGGNNYYVENTSPILQQQLMQQIPTPE